MVNGLASMNAMEPAEKSHHYKTRSNIHGKFKITKTHKKADTAFFNSGAKMWNEIPLEMREKFIDLIASRQN